MPIAFPTLSALFDHGFDTVIDVRSPAEFAEDHVPGAINLPALSNLERAQVGTIYKQVSPFDARKMGAAMVARNVAAHLDGPLAQMHGGWQPLIYCWRGGQRSGSFASMLTQIGWRAAVIDGGYQSFRRLVHHHLYDAPLPHRLILLDGNTGTGKTAILAQLALRDVQVLDLEDLAGHRGSMLGAMQADQPRQRGFETALAVTLRGLDPDRPVVVEAESSKIGRIGLPPALWTQMLAAPRIVIEAPIAARAAYLTRAYADLIAQPEQVARRLAPFRQLRGHAVVDDWLALFEAGSFQEMAMAMMAQHYDAAYAKSRINNDHQVLATVKAEALDAPGQARAANEIAAVIATL